MYVRTEVWFSATEMAVWGVPITGVSLTSVTLTITETVSSLRVLLLPAASLLSRTFTLTS